MRLRRAQLRDESGYTVLLWDAETEGWVPVVPALRAFTEQQGATLHALAAAVDDVVAFLAGGEAVREEADRLVSWVRRQGLDLGNTFDPTPLLPFFPRSFRDCSLWEQHMIDAARGIVQRFMPGMARTVRLYEAVAKRPFPRLRPKPMYYQVPVYYMGNHLNFYADGEEVPWPSYAQALDYELEVGIVIAASGRNFTPEEGERAIGGFVVLNDFSARDMQAREYAGSPFGPVVKAKNFANAMGPDVVTADEILPRFEALRGEVLVNDEVWSQGTTANPIHSLGEVVAYASWGETLYPGELIGTGTLPGCSGVEIGRWLRPGDRVMLRVEGIGMLTNTVGQPETQSPLPL